jgi:hypothetical protein
MDGALAARVGNIHPTASARKHLSDENANTEV